MLRLDGHQRHLSQAILLILQMGSHLPGLGRLKLLELAEVVQAEDEVRRVGLVVGQRGPVEVLVLRVLEPVLN